MQIKDAEKLLIKFKVPEHIIRHIKKVAYVSKLIGDSYLDKGVNIDLNSLICASLLHDLFRIVDINDLGFKEICKNANRENVDLWLQLRFKHKGAIHSEVAFKYLFKINEPKIAFLIKKHRFDAIIDPKDKAITLEEKILTYADKRVLHDKIVPLIERFADGSRRYNPKGINAEKEQIIQRAYFDLEKELFLPLDITPSDIIE